MNYELYKEYPLQDGFILQYLPDNTNPENIVVHLYDADESNVDSMIVKGGVTNSNFTHEEVVKEFTDRLTEELIMPVLTLGNSSAYHYDIDALVDGLKLEIDGITEEDLLERKFEISFKKMNGKEIYELGEFDGF